MYGLMRASFDTDFRVRTSLFLLVLPALLATVAHGQNLAGGGGLTPDQELNLEFADRLLAAGLADYSAAVVKKMTLPPEIMDIRKIKNFAALGKFDEAKAVIATRGGDTQEAWTLKLMLADGYYMWGKYGEAQGIYNSFFDRFPAGPKEGLQAFYLESAYKYAQMMLMMDNKDAAVKAYRAALKAKPERGVERQLKSELSEILLQQAQDAEGARRDALLVETRKIVDEILWIQDLWFGRGIVMLAHMKKMQGDIDGAMALIDDYKPQLIDIDKALRDSADETGDDLTKLSPMAQCRFMIGVIQQDEAKRILKQGGDRQRALDLLIGETVMDSHGKSRSISGALQHFLNVFIRYPNTSWAPECGTRFREVEETLKEVWGKEVRAQITPEQWQAVELAQFREARSLFNQQRFKEAAEAYEQVLSLFPERETSVAALGELAACYIELEEDLLSDVVIRHLAERFCRNEKLSTQAGDQVVRVALKYSERNDDARMRETYDVFFTYFKKHPRTSSELFRFAEEEFRANNLDRAMGYYEQLVADHKDKLVYFDALSREAFVYSKQNKPAEELRILKQLIDEVKQTEHPGHTLISAMFRFANALKVMGPKYLPIAVAKYAELETLLGAEESRLKYQKSAEEGDANLQILQGAMFYRAMSDCMLKDVPADVQAAFDKKYKRPVPPELILKTYYKAGAIKTLLELVERFPKSPFAPTALNQVGTLYTVLEKPDEARKVLLQLQKDYPESDQAKNVDFMIGLNLLEMGMEREALVYFKEMFSNTSGNYSAWQILTAGRTLYDAKQYEVAVQAFDRIIKTEKDRGYLEPARVGKGRALCELKKFKEASEVLRAVLVDYPSSGYTLEICLSASQAFAAVASETADAAERRALFDEAVVAMKRARKFAKEPGKQAELDVGVARIFERKAASELQFGDAAKAEEYRNDAVAAYQTVIMFRNPNDKAVAPHVEDAYLYCLPLLLDMQRWDDAMQDADRCLTVFPNGKNALKIRQYQNKARVSGGTKADAEAPEATEDVPTPEAAAAPGGEDSAATSADEPMAAATTPEEE